MYDILISVISNLFRVLLIRKFMKLFFVKKAIDYRWEQVVYSLLYFATLTLFLVFNLPIINLMSNFICLFIVTSIYSGSIKKKVFGVLAIYSINMICDTIAAFSLASYIIGGENSHIFEIFSALLLLVCVLFIEKLVDRKKQLEFSAKYWWILFLIPLCSIVMLFFMLYRNLQDRFFIVVESLSVLVINIIVFYLYNRLLDSYAKMIEKEDLEKKVKIYSNQLEVIMHTQERVRSLQHDMKHHAKEIYTLAKQKENLEIEDYIQRMMSFMDNPDECVYSGNKEVDGVLNYLLETANRVLNEVNVKISIPEDLEIPMFDLNVILGNLLENAIEASKKSDEKIMSVCITLEKNILFINISNTFDGNVEVKKGVLYSTKKKPNDHGIGLRNVKKIVDNYNGVMDITYEDKLFEVDIMLYMNKVRS